MPLSEHEQRQLEQIEQALYAEHPRLARAMRAKDPKVHYRRRVIQAAVGFVVGVGAVAAGFFLKYTWLAGGRLRGHDGLQRLGSFQLPPDGRHDGGPPQAPGRRDAACEAGRATAG